MAREKRAEAAEKRIQHGSTQRPRHALVLLPPGPNTVRRVRKPLPTPTGGSASYGAPCGRVFIPLHPPLCPLSTSASSGYWPPHVAHFGLQGRASSPALPAAAGNTFSPGNITFVAFIVVIRSLRVLFWALGRRPRPRFS